MLRVDGISNQTKEIVEIDEFIPLKIRFDNWDSSKENIYYWRTGDFDNTLFEIGITSMSHSIHSITIVQGDKNSFEYINYKINSESNIKTYGIPKCNIEKWEKNRILDESGPFFVYFNEESIVVVFNKERVTQRVVTNGRVEFHIDNENFISSIQLNDLSYKEKQFLLEQF